MSKKIMVFVLVMAFLAMGIPAAMAGDKSCCNGKGFFQSMYDFCKGCDKPCSKAEVTCCKTCGKKCCETCQTDCGGKCCANCGKMK